MGDWSASPSCLDEAERDCQQPKSPAESANVSHRIVLGVFEVFDDSESLSLAREAGRNQWGRFSNLPMLRPDRMKSLPLTVLLCEGRLRRMK